jgi:hypothetical protein
MINTENLLSLRDYKQILEIFVRFIIYNSIDFKTELIALLPLYDSKTKSIIEDKDIVIDLYQLK